VGVLGDWIVETVDALWSAGETVLTMEALTKHALQPDQRARLEMEVRTGEYKVARAKAQSELELQQLLGTANTPVLTTAPMLGRSTSRIERAAQRDPVGDSLPTVNALKCPFTSQVDIPFQRFLDSGTARVECPECRALRQVTPRNGVLRFPSHDKRKTLKPQTEQRWVQRETGWEVILGMQVFVT